MNEPLLIDLRLPPLTLTQRPLLAAGMFFPLLDFHQFDFGASRIYTEPAWLRLQLPINVLRHVLPHCNSAPRPAEGAWPVMSSSHLSLSVSLSLSDTCSSLTLPLPLCRPLAAVSCIQPVVFAQVGGA